MCATSSGDPEYGDRIKLPVKPVVSVCIATHQHASFIKEAIDSVLMQKVDFPYEICIGEDGSTDGTREICLEYARKHPDKIRLFLRDRSNPARNGFTVYMFNSAATFDACRGKYIALLDGDDYWLRPDKLQMQVNQLEGDPGLAASCHYAACILEGKPWFISVTPTNPVESFSIEDILKRDIGNLHTSTWLLRRGEPLPWKGFGSCHFWEIPIIVWTMLQGRGFAMPCVSSMYRAHPGGVFSLKSNATRLQWNVDVWNCLGSIVPPSLNAAYAIGVSRTYSMLTREYSKGAKFGLAVKCFGKNLSQITRNQLSETERGRLQWHAFESLMLPHLEGIRNRWNARKG